MWQIRSIIGAMVINPELLTCTERLQYEGFLRREEADAAIFASARDNVAITQIVKHTGKVRAHSQSAGTKVANFLDSAACDQASAASRF